VLGVNVTVGLCQVGLGDWEFVAVDVVRNDGTSRVGNS